ncbi:glycosyltransferase family 4 protein [Glonium stellatum]|uniref:Glycosyltransferase family 4 protein n=1 Tax=Glonium stellatum TaxID=574774 RepID=A0A8E2JV17_9PEZI|nr:glycosyltransferase family 4 protein [Glonium stellatum]
MAEILGISAFGPQGILKHWWQWVLIIIIGASVLAGTVTFSWAVLKKLWRVSRNKPSTLSIPRSVTKKLQKLHKNASPISSRESCNSKPSSFGVYLGPVAIPPTENQARVLSQWDAIIVDPFQSGILDAIDNPTIVNPSHVIGRLDLETLLDAKTFQDEPYMLRAVDIIASNIQHNFKKSWGYSPYTGILIAGWRSRLPAPFLNALSRLLTSIGLDVFLEIGPPDFLEGVERPDLQLFSGIVVRNGTILPNGERRDFFAMDKMKSTTKAFVSQSCLRSFTVMMWETVDDDVKLSHAVARRSHMWCGYHGALTWIGPAISLKDASKNRPYDEPLAAFQWLKDRRVMNIHEVFRSARVLNPKTSTNAEDYGSIVDIFPSLGYIIDALEGYDSDSDSHYSASTLTVQDPELGDNAALLPYSADRRSFKWTAYLDRSPFNPLSRSPSGNVHDFLGCFPIGLDVTREDFDLVVKAQQRLRRLNLLSQVPSTQLHEIGTSLSQLGDIENAFPDISLSMRQAIRDLAKHLANTSAEANGQNDVLVYVGLDSGFHTPAGAQFWAVHEFEPRTGTIIFYVSKLAHDLPSILLHTYLSSRTFQRYQCFLAEYTFAQLQNRPVFLDRLPQRLQEDLNLLSPTDLLLSLQHFRFSQWGENCPLLRSIRHECEELLLDVPSYRQLKRLSNMEYLRGNISQESLVNARLTWYRQRNLLGLDDEYALQIFRDIDVGFRLLLENRSFDSLDRITSTLDTLIKKGTLDYLTDYLLFSVFCAARKAAFEEVYIEVSDRNPLFNEYSDQSAAFAELFALGSRCEAYFDITPSDFGILLSEKHRAHYNKPENQPPLWINNAPSFASAYAAAQTDIDPNQKASTMPGYRRFTFLSVFAIPALVDITLLTTTGHGLYLSAFMSFEEQKYATLALMVSLLLSGAIGTWISIGGTYYIISMAFSAANMFVLTRLIGGLAFTLASGLIGFIIISAIHDVQSGAIFFFYLLGLTSYLSVLAVLSTYQFPGSSFLNGRVVIICVIPTLIISPVLTLMVTGHDVIIYLSVLYLFVTLLILGTRHVGSQWVTWYNNIKTLDDAAVKAWYVRTNEQGGNTSQVHHTKTRRSSKASNSALITSIPITLEKPDAFVGLSEPAILALCRTSLYGAVIKERNRRFWQKKTSDALVRELATCWDSTIFLLDWYCRLTDVKRPIPYSSTWNLETQVALDSMQQAQKGIRLHNSFIHWRNAGDEIGCGILYFLTALLDRWLELIDGGQLVGLSAALNKTFRLSVGFGLAYYLIGAVLLDYKAQHLHQLSEESAPVSIQSTKHIREAKLNDEKFRRHLYWTTLWRFLGVHVWALSLSAALIWIFNGSESAMIMFLSYVAAYSGLLLYQYNKIFSGPHTLMPLLTAVAIGFPIGLILKRFHPKFEYNGVIALNAATWTAALLSLSTAKLGWPDRLKPPSSLLKIYIWLRPSKKLSASLSAADNLLPLPSQTSNGGSKLRHFHAYCSSGSNPQWSQSELEAFYDSLRSGPKENRFKVHAFGHPGSQVKSLLLSCTHQSLSKLALDAFPMAPYWVQRIVSTWENGDIAVYIVPMHSVTKDINTKAISCFSEDRLSLLLASDSHETSPAQLNISSNCQIIAEILFHACVKSVFGISQHQAEIAESLLSCKELSTEVYSISECTKRSIPVDVSEPRMASFTTSSRKELLQNICLGIDCDTSWDSLPREIRSSFLKRCIGHHRSFSSADLDWISSNIDAEPGCTVSTTLARYDLAAVLSIQKCNYSRSRGSVGSGEKGYCQQNADFQCPKQKTLGRSATSFFKKWIARLKTPFAYLYHTLGTWIKFLVLSAMADLEYQRELNCVLMGKPRIFAKPATLFLTSIWIYGRAAQAVILPFFLYHRRKGLQTLSNTIKGSIIKLKKGRLLIQNYDQTSTAFMRAADKKGFRLYFYTGVLKEEPASGHSRISTFGKDMRLYSRQEYLNGEVVNEFIYDYADRKMRRLSKVSRWGNSNIPLARTCVRGKDEGSVYRYNWKGHIESGSYMLHGNLVRFKYHYRKNARYDDELLRAEFVLPHITCNVSWCAPPIRHAEKVERWIPNTRVHEATFVQGADVYECSWLYDHKFHPTITTKLNGQLVDTPEMIRHDWLGVLKKPTHCTFADENPLIEFRSANSTFFGRLFGRDTKRQPISTARARSQLWKAWKKRVDLDGVVIRWVDEQLLRGDSLLRPYWRRRDRGSLVKAEDYLALHADAVMASSDLSSDISAWTPLAIRMSDLFSFGQGGDAVIYTRTKTLQPDTDKSLHVIAVDTGTWPNEGGGVSACRRDLINNLRTIKWHMVVESANDFGLPKHQTEENVESLKVIPLWGLDFLHPCHGMFSNKLDSEVDGLFKDATMEDVRINFLPTLTALVRGARAINMTSADVKQATRALINLNTYFQDSRHWKEVWTSDLVKDTWRKLWLADDMPNAKPPSQWFNTERPTLGHLDTALELWFRYLFIFSIPIPEKIPTVFQASHHSVSASYGIVCKIKRNCTLQIWDHAISWRETNLYLSSALCTLPPFIRNSLLGLMKMTSTLILHHADQILPCADFFNPGWEVEIGSCQGSLTHRNVFRRKVDPIVNGITDMQKFAPVTEIKTTKPTVTMLSHVWFAKDIKTALLAADIISNEWGFKDYRLDIYGALNKAPVYSSECQEILACKGLGSSVTLRGTADPAMVLANTWLFLNSSVSEGLPLALGEAALTGAPVVCTDVGASLRVLTDPDDGKRYSEVVAPNDAYGLARAQINLLAMLDEWAQYAEDDPNLPTPVFPHKPSPEDVEIITKRMYDKTEQRRKLGMMARSIVQKSFSGERYLREHEQMLWVGKSCYEMLGLPTGDLSLQLPSRLAQQVEQTAEPTVVDAQLEKMQHPRPPWSRHFSNATSFSSVYIDEPGPSTNILDWGNLSLQSSDTDVDIEAAIPLQRPRPARVSSVEKTSAASVGITTLEDRISVLSRKLGATSSRSSQRVRSGLCEVQTADYGDTDDGT